MVSVAAFTLTVTGSSRYLSARSRTSGGIVAEKSAVWREPGVSDRIRSTSSKNPRSSISSASSRTTKRAAVSSRERREIRSSTRPTVPTTIWPPARSCACWERMGAPPNTATTSTPLRAA